MAIYLKHPKIPGSVTHASYKDWVEVSSARWEVGRCIANHVGSAKNREASEPWAGEITFQRTVDVCTPRILEHATKVKEAYDVELVCVASGNNEYLRLTLRNAMLSCQHGQLTGQGDDREEFHIAYTKLDMKFTPRDKDNKPGSPIIGSFDLEVAG
ncbi:Hcp family type VI secretion system effector [Chelatococcus sp. GCM10030263]|uniref:Hcp family type VI secretion system effector n=1 Tax=Chelatococcus sp. GCM10030263 TaxID=3273387 RepID=UPI00361060F8